jgi:flavin reductase (DIM6/NTAB) family NADH-FMN oxidoreductase RutF
VPSDETLNKVMWSIPNVLCLVGSRSGDEWNGMTQSWVTQVSMEPVLVAISVDRSALTHRLITESQVFSVNLWDRGDTRPFVKFSKPATYENGELNGQSVWEGETGAPVFSNAIAYAECTVWGSTDVGTHTVFFGEVVNGGFQGVGSDADVARMEDTRMKYGGVRRGGH